MQTVNHYFDHIGIFGMHLLGFLVQRAVVQVINNKNSKRSSNLATTHTNR